jgi:signal transduction histidine kinase
LAAWGWITAAGVAVVAWRAHAGVLEAVARTCHELRGPLTAARLGLALGVRDGRLPPFSLRAIDLELERAGLAVDDLARAGRWGPRARLSCLAAGHLEDVDLHALLARSVEAVRGAAAQYGARVTLRPGHAVVFVRADRLRLAQAVGNLLVNAIEHGGGEVEVGMGSDGRTVRVEITDAGPGLPAPVAELARRARGGRGRRGRGLAIALAIAYEHGGRLAAAPSERGARLVLELSARDHAAARADGRSPADPSG